MGAEKKFDLKTESYFVMYSLGLNTSRDAWCYNYSKKKLANNIKNTTEFFNAEVEKFKTTKRKNPKVEVSNVIDINPTKISWDRGLKNDVASLKTLTFQQSNILISSYRPFCNQYLYFDRSLNAMLYQNTKLFPDKNYESQIICVSSVGSSKGLSVLITNHIANLHFNGDTQCFPLYYYEEREKNNRSLFDDGGDSDFIRRDGISDFIFERAKKQYGKNVSKEDIFFYVYGFLHSPVYQETFANDLKKMLPRMPLVEDVRDFWAFSKAGRKLAELHINYETVPPSKAANVKGTDSGFFTVEKMRFQKKDQKDTILFNSKITISNIPAKAYEYVVNGKSAIDWIIERYQVTTHKESGIQNDPNDWAKEVGNPRYILDLLLSVINVSVQTVEIVDALPKVKFEQ
jgi:predicted helicase